MSILPKKKPENCAEVFLGSVDSDLVKTWIPWV